MVVVVQTWVVVVANRRVVGEPFVGGLEQAQDMVVGMVGEQGMVEDMVEEQDLEQDK